MAAGFAARYPCPCVDVVVERFAQGITQETLANDTQLHQRWISNVETGKRNPSYVSLRRLATGLGLNVSELIARAEQLESDATADSNPLATSSRR